MIRNPFRKKKESAPPAGPPLVAMIDDEQDLCRLVAIALEHHGYAVASAYDGEAGLALIRQRRPALVLLDIQMPRMNGYQVLTQMQHDPELARLPVIVMTSLDAQKEFSEEEWARRLGVARFLAKPFDPWELITMLRTLLLLKE